MSDPAIVNLFSRPQLGGDLPYFKGKQYGKGFLKEVERLAYPILIRAGKALGRIAVNSMDDYLHNKKGFGESLAANATAEFDDVKDELRQAFKKDKKNQKGSGMRKRKKPHQGSGINKRRNLVQTTFGNL